MLPLKVPLPEPVTTPVAKADVLVVPSADDAGYAPFRAPCCVELDVPVTWPVTE
jgi:hypothetical protein